MPWEGAGSPYHQPPGRLLEKTLFSIIKKMLVYCTFAAQNKYVFQSFQQVVTKSPFLPDI